MKTIAALWVMTRPLNAVLTGAAVLLGISLGRGEAGFLCLIFGPLSAMLVAAFANINNDIADLAIDRINRPDRPLPSGRISLKSAFVFSMVTIAAGLLCARVCGRASLAVAGVVAVFLILYNRWGKHRLLIGNLLVAIAGGMPLVYAGIIADPAPGRWKFLWLGFALGVAFHLAREVLKDIQDIEGDTRAGRRTLPIVLGVALASRFSGMYLLLIALLSITPVILRWLNEIYLYGLVLLIILPSAFCCFRLWRIHTPQEAGRWSTVTKGMMVVGLILLWLGAK